MIVYRLSDVVSGQVVKRPSNNIKSPYVADVIIDGEEYLVHSPSLGCSGLCEAPNEVAMIPTPGNKCSYRIQLAKYKKVYICTNPKISEHIVNKMLKKNIFPSIDVQSYKAEVTKLNSRFDFAGVEKHNQQFILEVKSVPLKCDKHTAYFPTGFRKKKSDPISPRALKHVQELQKIKQEHTDMRCILCFVINRHDIKEFKINPDDPIYRKAVQEAWMHGVEIIAFCIKWSTTKGKYINKTIPIKLFDEYGVRTI